MFQNVEKNEINEERGVEKIGMLWGGKITIEVILIEKNHFLLKMSTTTKYSFRENFIK